MTNEIRWFNAYYDSGYDIWLPKAAYETALEQIWVEGRAQGFWTTWRADLNYAFDQLQRGA